MRPVTDSQRLAELIGWCSQQTDIHAGLDAAMAEAVGHRLFTCLAIDHTAGEAVRIHANRPRDFPVGARLSLGEMPVWRDVVLPACRPWIGRSADDLASAFATHEAIAALDCAACLTLPVIDGRRVTGLVNLLHEAAYYDEASIAAAAPFAPLMVAPFRAFANGDQP